jgi:hypothetical protein
MIDREHALPLTWQATLLKLSLGSLYYQARPVPPADLAIMRRIDELHLDYPFAGSRMLRNLLSGEGVATAPPAGRDMMKHMAIQHPKLGSRDCGSILEPHADGGPYSTPTHSSIPRGWPVLIGPWSTIKTWTVSSCFSIDRRVLPEQTLSARRSAAAADLTVTEWGGHSKW